MLDLLVRLRFSTVVFCLSAMLGGCESGQATDEPYYHLVQGNQLELQDHYIASRKFVGNIEAKQKVDLAFELPGTVLRVMVDEGDTVSAGDVLMQLDIRLLEDERKQLQAQKSEVLANQTLASLQLERQQQLQRKGLAAQQRRDELDAQMAVFEAKLKQLQSRLSAVEVRMSQSLIKAPYDAYVSARYFDAGAVVNPGQAVLQLLDRSSLEARVGVPAKLARTLENLSINDTNNGSANKPSQVTVTLPDQSTVEAKVITVGRAIDPVTRTVSVRLALPKMPRVVNGDLVFLNVDEVYQEAGFWVPLSALSGSVRGMWNLMVLVPSQSKGLYKLEARSVELLHRAQGKVFIRGGIAEDEHYLAKGLHRTVAGQLVRMRLSGVAMTPASDNGEPQ